MNREQRAVTSGQRTYEELEHTADWAIRVWGDNLASLFEHAAQAMFELQGVDLTAEPTLSGAITCRGIDLETLLVAWLNELLYTAEINDAAYTRFTVRISRLSPVPPVDEAEPEGEYVLNAAIAGLPGRGSRAHIKAVTYHRISVVQARDRWEATVTFDT